MPEANGAKGNNQQLAYDAEKDKTQELQNSGGDWLKEATLEQKMEWLKQHPLTREPVPSAPKKKTSSKKNPRPKAAELKEMQDLSGPEYQPLDKLSPDELMDTVVSTYYEPGFMQPKIETIISHNWDDIFSRTGYNWRVVLRKPHSV